MCQSARFITLPNRYVCGQCKAWLPTTYEGVHIVALSVVMHAEDYGDYDCWIRLLCFALSTHIKICGHKYDTRVSERERKVTA